ncbi:phosphoethanolamine transferase [Betaproteobacteria bacterium]|nr:phosphoethanolamine transferase [Betaproteobacteria bacterium]GHU46597.1 phosphoethanolamine transferase [Betaproteobacteria bacterium]
MRGKTLALLRARPAIGSNRLLLVAAVYLGFCLNFSLWRYLAVHLTIDSLHTFAFALSFPVLLMSTVLLLINLFAWPYLVKPILLSLILMSSVANFMMFNYGVLLDVGMIQNVFETDTREAFGLVSFTGIVWVFFTGVIPALLLMRLNIQYRPALRETGIRMASILFCGVLVWGILSVLYKDYASFGRANTEIKHLISPINYIYSTARYLKRQSIARRDFKILDAHAKLAADHETPNAAPRVLVLVIGETARASSFALNGYARPTNPQLLQEDVINFSNVASCGTATAISVPCIFSAQPRREFSKDAEYKVQNLLDLLQLANYDIFWRDNDSGCKDVCERVPTEKITKNFPSRFCDSHNCFDEVLLENLDQRLATLTRNTVIVLHAIGNHGPAYYERYPEAFRQFTPDCRTGDLTRCSQAEIINSYDNAILYTDFFLAEAIRMLKRFPNLKSSLLYVSDHGESLGENGRYLHGMPYAIAPDNQKKVPMIFWLSDKLAQNDQLDAACLGQQATENAYSHDNLFHSLLGLMRVDTKLYDARLDIFGSCRKANRKADTFIMEAAAPQRAG